MNRTLDVFVEYAKASPEDILIRIKAINRGPEAAELHLIPTLWFRNTWGWCYDHDDENVRPVLRRGDSPQNGGLAHIAAEHPRLVSRWAEPGMGERRLLAICRGHRMKRILRRMLDETEFLSPYGVRALSRYHAEHPYGLEADGMRHTVAYEPAESSTGLFGGNSNWRGPIWFPVNYLLIESLQQFHHYYGDDFKVECPTGSGAYLTLREIADELSQRLIRIFLRDGDGRRAVCGGQETLQRDPQWHDHLLFYEYFHGDNGAGIGASHQTGWTGLVAKLIQQQSGHARQ